MFCQFLVRPDRTNAFYNVSEVEFTNLVLNHNFAKLEAWSPRDVEEEPLKSENESEAEEEDGIGSRGETEMVDGWMIDDLEYRGLASDALARPSTLDSGAPSPEPPVSGDELDEAATEASNKKSDQTHRRVASLPVNITQDREGSTFIKPVQVKTLAKVRLSPTKSRIRELTKPSDSHYCRSYRTPSTCASNHGQSQSQNAALTRTPATLKTTPASGTRTQWPKETRFTPPPPLNSTLINLKDQPATLRDIPSLAIVLARENLLKTDGWPSSTPSAHAEKILYRAEHDPDYGALVGEVIIHSQGLLRTQIKDIAAEVIPEILELEGIGRKEVEKKINLLLIDDHFALPWDDEMITTNLLKSFPATFIMTNSQTGEEYPAIPLTLISMAAAAMRPAADDKNTREAAGREVESRRIGSAERSAEKERDRKEKGRQQGKDSKTYRKTVDVGDDERSDFNSERESKKRNKKSRKDRELKQGRHRADSDSDGEESWHKSWIETETGSAGTNGVMAVMLVPPDYGSDPTQIPPQSR
ncbi:hypothetical protein BDN72DRAFT_864186 [Pluteus cervinus]|uniref:Uncharacterized protein n=1 Tax=Pluteus cervinus TaxID=181527 RepID=A0ACD3A4T0_9AGAR|nr:hypothetical protein BDN72DRAFT_864186 [Pluteus cervinus]